MKFNIKVTNKETKTVWFHENLSKDEISWIACNANLIVEIKSQYIEEIPQKESELQN